MYDPRTTRLDPNRPAGTTRYVRDPFPGNRIPTDLLNPVGARLLAAFPLPNQRGDGASNANNYYSNAPSGLDTDRVDTRVDHAINGRHRLTLRFNWFENRIANPDIYGNGMTMIADNRIPGINLMGRHTWILTASTLFEHHYSFALSQSNRTNPTLGYDVRQLGLPLSVVEGNDVTTFPLVTANRIGQIGTQVALERNMSKVFQYLGTLTTLKGRHSIKGGLDIRSYPIRLSSASQLTIRGAGNFTGGPNPQAASAASGSGAADLLLGAATVSNGIVDPDFPNHRYFALFVQDQYRVAQNLSLTYGLRYNLELPWEERGGHFVNLDLTSPSPLASHLPQLNLKGGIGFVGPSEPTQRADKNNIDPRAGAAWTVRSRTACAAASACFTTRRRRSSGPEHPLARLGRRRRWPLKRIR